MNAMPNDAKKWTSNQIKFQVWLAQPKEERIPFNQEHFAKKIGVVDSTLSRWKRLEGWDEAVIEIARKHLLRDLPQIYAALSREARKGSIQHIRTALELAGEMSAMGTEENPFIMAVKGYTTVSPDDWDD